MADATLIKLLRANVRTPDQTLGDIWALVGANELMARRLVTTLEEYDRPDVRALADELFSRSEAAMRDAIRAVPEGTYRYGFDTDGSGEPFEFELALTIRDGEIIADYTGTSPQQPRAINCAAGLHERDDRLRGALRAAARACRTMKACSARSR